MDDNANIKCFRKALHSSLKLKSIYNRAAHTRFFMELGVIPKTMSGLNRGSSGTNISKIVALDKQVFSYIICSRQCSVRFGTEFMASRLTF